MTSWKYIVRSLVQYRRLHIVVGLAVAVATAVLTGALLVGDSMQGSLRDLALRRLGHINNVLLADRFISEDLATSLQDASQRETLPALVLRGAIVNPNAEPERRAVDVQIIGCDAAAFQKLSGEPIDENDAWPSLGRGEILLNDALAARLGITNDGGDSDVLLRLPLNGAVPTESLLGDKENTIERARATVRGILSTEGLARFALRPTQQTPLNAFVDLAWLQRQIDREGKVNTLLVAGPTVDAAPSVEDDRELQSALHPTLDDYGLHVDETPSGWLQVTSDRMLLDNATQHELDLALRGEETRATLIYLADAIRLGDRETPYSTVAAMPFPTGEPMLDVEGHPIAALADDEIVLNAWTAEDLGAKVGDSITLSYFEPEDIEDNATKGEATFRLAAIAAMQGLGVDKTLTPEVEGLTDQLDMGRWDAPFPYEPKRVRQKDEDYWDEHGTAPKAFLTLDAGRRLWASRFGDATSIRIAPREGLSADTLRKTLEGKLTPENVGFAFQPIKRRAIKASSGATPFNVLFLAFSFFLIAAALMLVGLLFRLSVELRAREVGALLAVGFTRRGVIHLLRAEGLMVAAIGAIAGVLLGVAYAWLMVVGLTTLWLDAIGTPFLTLHVGPWSLAAGYLASLAITAFVIAASVRALNKTPVRRLLAEQSLSDSTAKASKRFTWQTYVLTPGCFLAAIAMLLIGWLDPAYQAAMFFLAGAGLLAGMLAVVRFLLRRGATGPAIAVGGAAVFRLARRNASRNPMRSVLSIALIATAGFLIVSVSAFRMDPTDAKPTLHGGEGGYTIVATSDMPILENLSTDNGLYVLGFGDDERSLLESARFDQLRVLDGDNASCLNLYQATRPRVLGVSNAFIDRNAFAWSTGIPRENGEPVVDNPWELLRRELPPTADGVARVPIAIERDTANYALHIYAVGATIPTTDADGEPLLLEVVGLLGNGILAGDLIASEDLLMKHFPDTTGYRFVLIETPTDNDGWRATRDEVIDILNTRLGDHGLFAESSGERRARFLAIQNTYLLTFQSLGGLGLLLGTFGLAAVQMRNVLERRRELALLRAVGFPRSRIGRLVLMENAALLMTGLAIGVVAAGIAITPQLLDARATIPWAPLGVTLLLVLVVGLFSGMVGMRAAINAPLTAALRGD